MACKFHNINYRSGCEIEVIFKMIDVCRSINDSVSYMGPRHHNPEIVNMCKIIVIT